MARLTLSTVNTVKSIGFALEHTWDFKFLDEGKAPSFFSTWFPAFGVDRVLYRANNFQFKAMSTVLNFPQNNDFGNLDFSVYFIDLADSSIEDYFRIWVDSIYSKSQHSVARLSKAYKVCEVKRLNNDNDTIVKRPLSGKPWNCELAIIPQGELRYLGKSSTGFLNYACSFKVVGSSDDS